ncbi:uncharacterized protein LOC117191425 [Drosophila miranda]|uniref:uncharacterized protein LOC117191425 n=1 Tax=Drosophila miranda TaxID=7229 RepID=UPI00143F8899|nr:uncharacterized protein LOC117191425 [Drosophila miranda]
MRASIVVSRSLFSDHQRSFALPVVVVVVAVAIAGLCVLSGLNAAPLDVQCNCGDAGTQHSADGLQTQTQAGPGCQTQTSENGTQSQSQSGSGNSSQSQTQCTVSDCAPLTPFPPLFTMKPMEPLTWKPLDWGSLQPIAPLNGQQQQQQPDVA